jgi:hypothetical protein
MNQQAKCEGKEKLTHQWAKKLARMLNRRKKREITLTGYKCDFCGYWHIGRNK